MLRNPSCLALIDYITVRFNAPIYYLLFSQLYVQHCDQGICCSSIFALEQFVFELGQNSLNWYKIV